MKYFLLIVFTLSIQFSNAQFSKVITIPFSIKPGQNKDTSFRFKEYSKLRESLKLVDLLTSKDKFHFRIWSASQVVDIWSFDNEKYFGTVTNFAERYSEKSLSNGEFIIDKFYTQVKPLDSLVTKYIYQSITSLNILQIPTDNQIKDWSIGFGGEEYLIEFSDFGNYSFKEYWTPRNYAATISEAKRLDKFVEYLFQDLKIKKLYSSLKLPDDHHFKYRR